MSDFKLTTNGSARRGPLYEDRFNDEDWEKVSGPSASVSAIVVGAVLAVMMLSPSVSTMLEQDS